MIIYNKTILLPNLEELYELLNNNNNESLYICKCIYEDRIAIQHYIKNNMNKIQVWKTKTLFDCWFNDFDHCNKGFIASFDYTIHENHIKIDNSCINDNYHDELYDNPLNEYDSEKLIKSLINFVKKVAIKQNKKKIILDVYDNLLIYKKYYYYIGFNKTDRICIDNPFWIETEMNL
jgi:hypothetical protein